MVIGARLGPYRIEERIGAGGMGEVYRARDTRLDRFVAIKILPAHLRQSPERRARFEREARTISRLMHPHVCTLLDIGREGDIEFLVMEYLEGETLAARLARGPIPLDRALQAGIEIAGALSHLHRHDVVHRDLKPSNVMLTRSGAKLLDFGIAKLRAGAEDHGLTQAPSTETAEGTLIGTLAYMAPEQLQGQDADARTDIWAFGCLLYETLTGHRAFTGKTHATLIAAILEREPEPLTRLQPIAPPILDHLVQTCLAKEADARWQSAADIERELRWIAHPSRPAEPWFAPMRRALRRRPIRVLAAGALLALFVVAAVWRIFRTQRPAEEKPFRISTAVSWPSTESQSRLSPDGNWLSFISDRDGDPRVFMQNIKSGEIMPIAAPAGSVLGQVWSPDGQEVALLLRQGQTVTIHIVPAFFGGASRAFVQIGEPGRLVRWIGQTIYFERRHVLFGVDDGSAAVREIFKPDGARWPLARSFDIGSDGRVAFTADTGGNADIWMTDARSASPARLTDHPASDTDPLFAGDYLFFQSSRAGQADLWRLNLAGGQVTQVTAGVTELVPEDATADGRVVSAAYSATASEIWAMRGSGEQAWAVTSDSSQDLWPSFSRDGSVIAYQRRKGTLDTAYIEGQAEIVIARWNGKAITESHLVAQSGFAPRLSPDGRRLAYLEWVHSGSDFVAVRMRDVATGRTSTVTERFLLAGYVEFPLDLVSASLVWSQDGSHLYFCESDASGAPRIARINPSTGETEQIVKLSAAGQTFRDLWLSPDGRRLAYNRYETKQSTFVVRDTITGREEEWFTDRHERLGRSQALGWDGPRLLIVRSRRSEGSLHSRDSLEFLSLDGTHAVALLRRLPQGYPATARLDLPGRRILVTLRENRADNLFAVPLDTGPVVKLTSNDLPSVSFSNVELGPDGLVLFARHDRKQDVWLIRQGSRP
jgi:serine/threonine protein kinase/WD40 repeat protein